MANDDRVLSQAEIDALLSSSLASAPAPKVPPPPPVPHTKVSAPPPPPKEAVPQDKTPVPPPPPQEAAPRAKAPAPAPAPAPQPAAPPPGLTPEQVSNLCRQVIAEETKDLQKQVIELTIKLNKLDTAGQRLSQLEQKIDQVAAHVKSLQTPKALKNLEAQITDIYSLLQNIRQHSDEERIRDQFQCVNCHSKKLVAIHVKCTSCGTENWMGWFPESRGNQQDK